MFPLSALISQPAALLLAYCAAVIFASVLGGMIPQWLRLTHTRMQLLISLVGGVMLGIAIFHMIPHAAAQLGPTRMDQLAWGLMLGLLSTFFLLRFFQFHQHGPTDFGSGASTEATHLCSQHTHATHVASTSSTSVAAANSEVQQPAHLAAAHSAAAGHAEAAGHAAAASDADSDRGHAHHESPRWLGVLLGLGMHTLLDGMALAASVKAEQLHDHGMWLAGFGTFLAVFLHKPLDAISITSLMNSATPGKRLLVNVGFALMCPVGALLFWSGADMSGSVGVMAGWALAFSAGVFLCISLSDLLPEMEFHSHSRIPLTLALLLGVAVAWAIGLVENPEAHTHQHSTQPDIGHDQPGHSHAGHDHAGDQSQAK